MSSIEQITRHRAELVSRAARQRDDIASAFDTLRTPLAVADKGVAAVAYVKSHPGIAVAAVVAAAVISPRRTLRWAQRALIVWRGARWLRSSVRSITERASRAA